MHVVLIPAILLLCFLPSCSPKDDDAPTPSSPSPPNPPQNPQPQPATSFPCFRAGLGPTGAGGAQQGSQYAYFIVGLAAQIGNISTPAGGVWSVPSEANARYDPSADRITYNANFLNGVILNTGLQEAGDAVIFHEVGHSWTFKTALANCIGFGNIESNWRHEYQADSFAGFVLRALAGNPIGSIAVYEYVWGQWSGSHPPGHLRAIVFMDGYTNATPRNMCTSALPLVLEPEPPAAERLRVVSHIRNALLDLGLNPYSTESDAAFVLACEGLGLTIPPKPDVPHPEVVPGHGPHGCGATHSR